MTRTESTSNNPLATGPDSDPAHQPITDWDAIDPLFVSSKDIADYEADHGTGSVPDRLKSAVLARESEAE